MCKLDTPFGTVELKPLSADHVFVDGTARSLNAPESVDYQPGLVVNGVALSVRLDLVRWADGSWNLGREDDWQSQFHAVYATRRDWTDASKMDASESARRKLREVLFPLVIEWIESPEGQEAIEAAAEADRVRRTKAKIEEIAKLQEQLRIARDELTALANEGALRRSGVGA